MFFQVLMLSFTGFLFWKAGEFEVVPCGDADSSAAFAELLDNAIDEVCTGATYVKSIGLLSYTFLKSTGKEDFVVPMVMTFILSLSSLSTLCILSSSVFIQLFHYCLLKLKD
ncbi:hypothetical protein RchiOBHm_Chr2g0092891 [Rosa chinensis]|uniref:Uncharacterized protein n=1 Tax=Rosa chinensis TaxID=74649 RepID=A0A2P6RK34_ROSCH|nr:hypothetical protein RchiOBHm_Chr2g0092891 [Rosa chinensis]